MSLPFVNSFVRRRHSTCGDESCGKVGADSRRAVLVHQVAALGVAAQAGFFGVAAYGCGGGFVGGPVEGSLAAFALHEVVKDLARGVVGDGPDFGHVLGIGAFEAGEGFGNAVALAELGEVEQRGERRVFVDRLVVRRWIGDASMSDMSLAMQSVQRLSTAKKPSRVDRRSC